MAPSALSISNNKTCIVPLPILDMILRELMAGPSLIEPRHLFALVQVSRSFRARIEPLLRRRLMTMVPWNDVSRW